MGMLSFAPDAWTLDGSRCMPSWCLAGSRFRFEHWIGSRPGEMADCLAAEAKQGDEVFLFGYWGLKADYGPLLCEAAPRPQLVERAKQGRLAPMNKHYMTYAQQCQPLNEEYDRRQT